MNESTNSPSIRTFLANSVARRGNEPALGFIRNGAPHWLTWQQVATRASELAAVLRTADIHPGDRVAQVSENRYEWVITDLALHLAGAVHVPLHVTLSGEQIAQQIIDCGARLVVVSSPELLHKFAQALPHDIVVLTHDEPESTWQPPALPGVLKLRNAMSSFEPPAEPGAAKPRVTNATFPDSLATILYTSGTTGRPRGVMLSHNNLASNAASLAASFDMNDDETRLCVLPLSHIYARTCDLYTWVYRGTRLVLAENRETLARDLQIVRPTALNAVPYIYQRIADRIRGAGGDDATALRNFFGGKMDILNCGGAPLAPDIEAWYADRGQTLLMGYGLTETSPVIAASTPRAHRRGAVGKLLPYVEVRVADDGELLTRGPNLMLGYWRDEAATADVIREGWFHTGDLGALDADGFLTIRGRKKELIVLSTGKKVAPTRIELLLTASPLVEQAAVFGDGMCGLVALIVPPPNATSACGLAQPQNATDLKDLYATEIQRCLASAAHEEQIHRFSLLDRPFSIERGEMTGKLSLCRNVIAENFADELKGLISQPLQVETASAKIVETAR
jgi:long-chain acyl-CoA synthetase